MNIIILGAGKVGISLTENFVKEGYDVVLIDSNEKIIEDAVNKYDVNGVVGNGLERSLLLEAGIESADYFISCTSLDQTNILCCVLAKKLGAKKTVARVRDPIYFNEMNNIKKDLGIDLAFNPEYRTATDIAQILRFPSAESVESFAGGKAVLIELNIEEGNAIIGKSLKDVSNENSYNVLFGMVKRGKEFLIPRGDFIVEENDVVYVIAEEKSIINFCKKIKVFKRKSKNVFIVGGGKIAYYLAKALISEGVNVKILEQDLNRSEELSEELPKATILCGDGTDQAILIEEGMANFDACVTLTGIDEENVIVSLFAKQKKIDKVVTKIDKQSVADMVKVLGLETIVSPSNSISNHILRFIRAHSAESGGGVNTLYKLHDKAEALEFTVEDDFSGKLIPLKELKLKRQVLIGGIVRDDKYLLPTGESFLIPKDKVIVITLAKQVSNLQDILR